MSTIITPAPFQPASNLNPSGIVFNAVNNGTSVTLSWSNTPFAGGSLPHFVTVGKEYGGIDLMDNAKECAGQIVECVASPDGQAERLPSCFTNTWDSVIAFSNFNIDGYSSITIPYNSFMLAGNGCAFQTDGVARTYFVKLTQIVGASAVDTKFLFNFTTPVATIPNPCGEGEVIVVPPPPVTTSTKGKKK